MADIEAALEIAFKSAGLIGMEQDDYQKISDRLNEYGKMRAELFTAMLALLAQYDVTSLDGDWKDNCSEGKQALSDLNDGVVSVYGGGFTGLDLRNFYDGETSIWNENGRAQIALAAQQIQTIHLANLKLIQDCNEALKMVLVDEDDVQKFVEGKFGALKEVLANTFPIFKAYVTATRYKGLDPINGPLKPVGDRLMQTYAEAKDAARKKQVILKALLARIKLLNNVKGKLDKDSIRQACDAGTSVADNLAAVGRDSPYEARDWDEFGKNCSQVLKDSRDRTLTDADTLFNNLYYRLDEQTQRSFETLSNDPAQWQQWADEIGSSFDTIQEALDNEQLYVDRLVPGPAQQGRQAAIDEAKVMLKSYIDGWNELLADIKDKLKKD